VGLLERGNVMEIIRCTALWANRGVLSSFLAEGM
jgi:hypothetical protein